jgi:hypothetical protein
MAKITQSLDDMSGDVLPEGTPTTTVTITDPRNSNPPFEIDLSDDSLKALLKAVERFRVKGREVTPPTVRNSATDAQEAKGGTRVGDGAPSRSEGCRLRVRSPSGQLTPTATTCPTCGAA